MHILVTFLLFTTVYVNPTSVSLYQPEDLVRILNRANFFREVSESENPWIINFYVHYCGHCRRFSKTYKIFSKQNSNKPINIGAINCAEETDICSKLKIFTFPTIKSIQASKKLLESDFSELKTFGKSRTVLELRKLAHDLIYASAKDIKRITPETFNETTLDTFYSHSVGDKVMLIVIDPDFENDLARSLVLDTMHCQRFSVAQVNDISEKGIAGIAKGNEIGVFGIRYKGDIVKLSSSDPTNITKIRIELYRYYAYICPDLAGLLIISTNTELSGSENVNKVTPSPVVVSEIYIDDVIGAVSFSLRHEVASHDITETDITALKNWTNVIEHCFPWPKQQLPFFKDISIFIENKKIISRTDLLQFLNSKESRNAFPEESKWKACQGSKEYFRGFPCSMWLLIHTMTINCEKKTSSGVDSVAVLQAAKTYIDHFFSCSYCRAHFLDMAANVEDVVKTPMDAIQWLWKSHNRVNARLRYDDSADPEHPKIQFPSAQLCEACYSKNDTPRDNLIITRPGFGVKEISWNWPEVYKFLKSVYSAENIRIKNEESDSSHEDTNIDYVSISNNDLIYTLIVSKSTLFLFAIIVTLCYFNRRYRNPEKKLLRFRV